MEKEWFLFESGQQSGPFSRNELRLKTRQGTVRPDTLAWRQGMPGWIRIEELPELISADTSGAHTLSSGERQTGASSGTTVRSAQAARTTYATACRIGGAAGAASTALPLPWQITTGTQQPDIRKILTSAAVPAARQALSASFKRPAIAMGITAVLDLAVAGITGGSVAMAAAAPRFLLGGATSLLSIRAGKSAGWRVMAGVVSVLTALVQAVCAAGVLAGGLLDGEPLITLLQWF